MNKIKQITDPRSIRKILSELKRKFDGESFGDARLKFRTRNTPDDTFILYNNIDDTILEFGFGEGRAAAFGTDGSVTILVHSGRVHRNRERFASDPDTLVDVGGRKKWFYKVSDVLDGDFMRNVVDFSCKNIVGLNGVKQPIRQSAARDLIDRGADVTFNRNGHSVDPKHAPIVNALEKHLKQFGWCPVCLGQDGGESTVRPDLVVSNEGNIILFEVKADDSPASFHCAIGQLLVYGAAFDVERTVIVSSGKPRDGTQHFEKVMDDHGIGFVRVDVRGTSYAFPGLQEILNGLSP